MSSIDRKALLRVKSIQVALYGRTSAEPGQDILSDQRLNLKKEKGTQKDG
jgi:hypothetical protein